LEKRRPSYDLRAVKAVCGHPGRLVMTTTAALSARALGFTTTDVSDLVRGIDRRMFYKSMTSYADPHLWQDVYHVPADGLTLYVKFTADVVTEFVLLSFKEKGE
jgi:motility quorum-sensing regulator/GCU-specific mRNA interferase toxin